MTNLITPDIEWTDDCQGKKDYDGKLLDVSSRYWPSGGGFHVYDSREPEKGLHLHQDGSPARAVSHIILRCQKTDHPKYDWCYDGIVLATQEFSGPSQQDVQSQVEAWVQEQFTKIALASLALFQSFPVEPSAPSVDPVPDRKDR